jgi:hypothetical protein
MDIVIRTALLAGAGLAMALRFMAGRPIALRHFERRFFHFGRRKVFCVMLVFAGALAVRVASLPIAPVKPPAIHDEFSYLLAADTFASGRLTNPPHPMWQHFETFHVIQQPTYMSMYPPAQGMALALGKVVFGRFDAGVCLSVAALCAAILWMLQGWLPPGWALFGGVLAVFRFAFAGYWATSYFGGAVAATCGALVLGALPRIMRRPRVRDAVVMGVGLVLLANSRPYEGAVLGGTVGAILAFWILRRRGSELQRTLVRTVVPLALVLAIGGAAMGYYFRRVTGNPLQMPYAADVKAYAVPPLFLWQQPPTQYHYRHLAMERFYRGWMLPRYQDLHRPKAFVKESASRIFGYWVVGDSQTTGYWAFFIGAPFFLPFLFFWYVVRDRRTRTLVLVTLTGAAALLAEVYYAPHYAAPFTAAVFGLVVQATRHLRLANHRSNIRILLTWSIPLACLAWVPVTVTASPYNIRIHPDIGMTGRLNSGFPELRQALLHNLETLPGNHLVIVRYSPTHKFLEEWVYNRADIDSAKVVFAREMDAAHNQALLAYFRDRRVWLLEPDSSPLRLQYALGTERAEAMHEGR